MQPSITQPDAALVTAARNGDRDAFAALIQRYQNLVCAIAYSRLGNLDTAHDIAQEAFLVSFETLPLLRSAAKFGPWLRRITLRLCTRWLRSERYRRSLKEQLQRTAPAQHTPTPQDIAQANETAAIVRHAIDRLSNTLRDVLVLHYFQGQSHAETARTLGISQAAVGKRVERAKRRIRQFLTSEIETELRKARPSDDFTKRTLAAIPAGSICTRLGLNVTKITLAEALSELAQATLQHASTILTGGIAVTITKATVAAAAALLLGVAGAGYLVVRYGRGSADGPGSATAVTKSAQESRTDMPTKAEALSEADTPPSKPSARARASRSPTVEELRDLILEGYHDLDPATREQLIRQYLRDVFSAAGSMESRWILLERLARELGTSVSPEPWLPHMLPLGLGWYDAMMDPRNWRIENGRLAMFGPHTVSEFAKSIAWMYAAQSRADEGRLWLRAAIDDIDAWLAQLPAGYEAEAAAVRRNLLGYKNQLQAIWEDWDKVLADGARLPGQVAEEDRVISGRIKELEDAFQADSFSTPADEVQALGELGHLYHMEGAWWSAREVLETAAQKEPRNRSIQRQLSAVKAEIAARWLTEEDQQRLTKSRNKLKQVGLAMQMYGIDNQGRFPARLEELVNGGYISDIVDPLSGEPFVYIAGFSTNSPPNEIVARSAGKYGAVACLYVDGHVTLAFEE